MLATLSGGFGGVALVLSLVSLYGVMSFVVTRAYPRNRHTDGPGRRGSAAVWLVLRERA